MKAIETLMSEHRVIEAVLARVGRACDAADKGVFDADSFAADLAFFREFADKRHHAKEEDLLFPAMSRRGMPLDGGPLACMLSEHDSGRGLLGAVAAELPAARAGDAAARAKVAAAYREYAAFLREHIYKEDNILYPMAERLLTPEDQAALDEEFQRLDAAAVGEKERAAVSVP